MDAATRKALQDATRSLLVTAPRPQDKPRTRHIIASDGRSRRGRKITAWPFASDALGVSPDQIEEARAKLAERGVSCDFDGEGRAIIKSQAHHMEVSRASGMFNGRDGFGIPDGEGGYAASGRQSEREKDRLRQAVERGEYQEVEKAFGIQFD